MTRWIYVRAAYILEIWQHHKLRMDRKRMGDDGVDSIYRSREMLDWVNEGLNDLDLHIHTGQLLNCNPNTNIRLTRNMQDANMQYTPDNNLITKHRTE
jgi:hypothetical protein